MITRPNGKQEIVVSGGVLEDAGNITEIFDLQDQTWRSGPTFPGVNAIWYGSSVQYNDSFLAVGGLKLIGDSDTAYTGDIWYFDVDGDMTEKQEEDGQWVKLSATMGLARQSFSAFFIPDELCP